MAEPVTALHARAGYEWPPPAPLNTARPRPEFPVHALPGWIADYVTALAEALQVPLDLPGCLALAALSTAAGGRAVVRVRPGWVEPVNIYTVVVAEPSERKSPVFTAIMRPIYALERQLREQAAESIEAARVHRRALESAQQKAEQNIAGKDGEAHSMALADAVEAALAVSAVDIPTEPKLVVDDITPEQVGTVLAAQGGRLAILSDEGGIFSIIAGRYSGEANTNVFLKGYTGTQLRVDRGSRPSELVEHPALTMGLTIQPAVIDELGKTALLRGSGFLARILYSLPASRVGMRIARPAPVPDHIDTTYQQHLHTLAHALIDWTTDTAVFGFSDHADDLMAELQTDIEPRLDPRSGDWAHISDWGGKLAGQTARIAGLLHTAQHRNNPWEHPVSADTFTNAITLSDYYAHHALAVFDQLATDETITRAEKILAWIKRTGPTSFTKRDAYNGTRTRNGTIRKSADLDDALTHLEDLGHIAAQPTAEPSRKGGRPAGASYWTHPHHRTQT